MNASSVAISLHEISVPCRLGWSEEERAHPQLVIINLNLSVLTSGVESTDQLEDTLDYCQVLSLIESECGKKTWRLLEKMSAELADSILAAFTKVERIEISIRKNIFANTKGVTLTRAVQRA